jgi:hypothetical protein
MDASCRSDTSFHETTRMRRHLRRCDGITLGLLGLGVAAPLLYYGVQVVAAPFFPGFSVLGTTASELGSDLSSTRPSIFNAGTILLGMSPGTVGDSRNPLVASAMGTAINGAIGLDSVPDHLTNTLRTTEPINEKTASWLGDRIRTAASRAKIDLPDILQRVPKS